MTLCESGECHDLGDDHMKSATLGPERLDRSTARYETESVEALTVWFWWSYGIFTKLASSTSVEYGK